MSREGIQGGHRHHMPPHHLHTDLNVKSSINFKDMEDK